MFLNNNQTNNFRSKNKNEQKQKLKEGNGERLVDSVVATEAFTRSSEMARSELSRSRRKWYDNLVFL